MKKAAKGKNEPKRQRKTKQNTVAVPLSLPRTPGLVVNNNDPPPTGIPYGCLKTPPPRGRENGSPPPKSSCRRTLSRKEKGGKLEVVNREEVTAPPPVLLPLSQGHDYKEGETPPKVAHQRPTNHLSGSSRVRAQLCQQFTVSERMQPAPLKVCKHTRHAPKSIRCRKRPAPHILKTFYLFKQPRRPTSAPRRPP